MHLKPIIKIIGISFLISLVVGSYLTFNPRSNIALEPQTAPQKPQVLGIFGGGSYSRSARPAQMYVYGGENSFGTGGVISMSSHDEPTLGLSAYNVHGTATINTYLANRESVIKYLLYNDEGMQVNKQVDKSNFELLGTSIYEIRSNNETNRIPLPIDGKGIWYVSIEIGGFTIDGFIIRSDVGLIAKEGDGEFVFWAQKFADGLSTSHGELKLYNLENQSRVLSTNTFDSKGIAEAGLTKDADIATYSNGDDFSLLPLNLQYLNVGSSYHPFAQASQLSRYFIFTDRPIYQPGQEVNFKAIIRSDDDARYSIPSGQATVTIKSGDDVKFEKSYPISADGSINGTYKLADEESVGYYTLSIDLGPKPENYQWGEYSSNSTYFNVQHYQKPEPFISVDSSKLEYISGDLAELTISGSYFSGQPLIATDIKYRVSALDYYEYSLYADHTSSYRGSLDTFYGTWYGSQTVAEGIVSLDNTGAAKVQINTKQLENPDENTGYTPGKSKILVVEVTQEDGSLAPSYSTKNMLVYAGDYGIYQNNKGSSGKINANYNLPLKLAPYFREVILGGIELNAKIMRETWVKDDVQNYKYPTYRKEEEDLGQSKLKTNSQGETQLTFTPTKLGYYKFIVEGRDQQDNYIAKEFYAYISDRDLPVYRGDDPPEISLSLDKDKYESGETAKLEIVTSIENRDVLVTVERGRLARYFVERINGKNKTIDLPLVETDLPNVYITVSSFNPFALDMAQINLPVSTTSKKIEVTISPDSLKYGPGETAEVELTTRDLSGNPVSSEVALWAVDKAIFELAGTNLGNIFNIFWAERSDTTAESHSLMGIMTNQAEGGGGGGETRSVFKDTAYWNPAIQTDKNGKAHVKIKLPDNLTTWTLAAVANTRDTRVGQSTKEITVNKDIVVRPIMPRIMRVGDQIKLSALVQNFTDQNHDFEVQLSFDSGDVKANTWENVAIESSGVARLVWELTPTKVNDEAKIKISARSAGLAALTDEIQLTIPVRQFGFLERTGLSGLDDQVYKVALGDSLDHKLSSAVLSLSPSLLGSLPSAMDYLVNYSYACVEQTVSRLVPALLVSDNPTLFVKTSKNQDYSKVIDKSLERLSTMQRGDGGWTWWYTGKSDPFITLYVVENLRFAQSLGYKVSPAMIDRASNYLDSTAKDFLSEIKVSNDPDLVSLRVLMSYNAGDQNPTTNGLSTLLSLAQSQGDAIFWGPGTKARFGSIETSTALALRAMITAKADRGIIDKTALYLTRNRKADYWGNTFATSQVLSALTAYAKVSADLSPNYGYQVSGDLEAEGTVKNVQTEITDLKLDLSKIKDNLSVKVTKDGPGNLYSTLVTNQLLTSRDLPSVNNGITITKKFENAKGSDLPIGVGDTVDVVLTISGLASDDKYGVIVDDLPSGLVPVNTALLNEQTSWNIPEDYEEGFNITDTDVTENGVVMSLYNIASEERTYRYKSRAVSAGTYAVPPATVSLMYAPEIHGRTSTSTLTVEDTPGFISGNLTNKFILNQVYLISGIVIIIILGLGTYVFIRARKRKHNIPPSTDSLPPNIHEV